jgi:hypothetical protein
MCLRFLEVVVLFHISDGSALGEGEYSYFLFFLGFAEVD